MLSLASLNCIAARAACLEQGNSIGWCQKSWEQKTRGTGIERELPRLANPAHVNTYSSGMFQDRDFVLFGPDICCSVRPMALCLLG